MQNYKEVCGNEEEVWFEIRHEVRNEEGASFLRWAKELGCVWINGKEIDPNEEITALHYTIDSKGVLAKIPLFSWFSKNGQFDHIKRYMFCEFLQGRLVSPNEYWNTRRR